jgi:purine-cytosine permease-like protein
MIVTRLIFGSAGALVLALVLWAIRIGWYPSHGERVSRAASPITFWSVMSVTAAVGVVFLLAALFT